MVNTSRLKRFFSLADAQPGWSVRRYVVSGFIAAIVIALTSAMRGWPFPSLTSEPWLYQFSTNSTALKYSCLFVFYVGVGVLSFSWYRLLQLARSDRMTTRQVFITFAVWSLPLFMATPLFSGDVYVYWVDGQAIARGFDPYTSGISSMGAAPDLYMVHPLWRSTSTMYGPIFVRMAEGVALLTPNSLIAGVLIFRAMAVLSLIVMAVSLRSILRHINRPVAEGLVFALLNPLIMLHLVGGAHNDAMMLAFLCSGLAIGLRSENWGWRVVALGLCAISGAFKIPGFAGALVLGWIWAGDNKGVVIRSIYAAGAGAVALAIFEVQALVTGLGWGWLNASNVPGLAHPLLAMPNAIAMSFGSIFGASSAVNGVTRAVFSLCAVIFATALIMRTGRNAKPEAVLRAFAWGLLAIAMTGPAVYPWYLVWGVALAGAVGLNTMRKPLILGLIGVLFFVAPGGYGFLDLFTDWRRTVVAFLTVAGFVAIAMHLYKRAHASGYVPLSGPKVSAYNKAVSENPSLISPSRINVRT